MKFATVLASAALVSSVSASVAAPAPVYSKATTTSAAPLPTATYANGSYKKIVYVHVKKVVYVKAPAVKTVYVKPSAAAPAKTVYVQAKPASTVKYVSVKPAATKAPVKVTYSTGATPGSWQDTCVKLHNNARSNVGAPPVTWNANLASKACGCSTKNANSNNLDHCGVGENLWKTSDKSPDYTQAIKDTMNSWVQNEIGHYPGGPLNSNDPNFHVYGHYSQVVWADSTQVGCCIKSGWGGTVVTCNYNPIGNFEGQNAY